MPRVNLLCNNDSDMNGSRKTTGLFATEQNKGDKIDDLRKLRFMSGANRAMIINCWLYELKICFFGSPRDFFDVVFVCTGACRDMLVVKCLQDLNHLCHSAVV